jgi:hypothetical protein
MEISEKSENIKIELNNHTNDFSLNSNNLIINKKDRLQENNYNKLKIGQFMLTPLEGIILNKKMPRGYKFELEENILKSNEIGKNQPKKVKPIDKHGEHHRHLKLVKNTIKDDKNENLIKEYSPNNKNKIIKKIVPKENSSNINININSESYKIMMKCLSCFNKIKSSPYSNFFYFSKFPDLPSLSTIEKKIKNFEYKNVNEFCEDLRKMWNYYFKYYAKEPNVYQNICNMSSLSDQVCKEISNENNVNMIEIKNEEFSNIKKRTDKIKKDLNEIKVNTANETLNKNIKMKNFEDINNLGHLIRTLSKQQLRGIISLLSDPNEEEKVIEFDLGQLPFDKYKQLEDYVKNCIYKNKNSKHIIHNNITVNNGLNKIDNIEIELKEKNISKKNIINNSIINKNFNVKENNTNPNSKNKNGKFNSLFLFSDSKSNDSGLSN